MKKIMCLFMLLSATLTHANQSAKEYNTDDYWFDYEVLHSSKAPVEWLSELEIKPSAQKHVLKISVRSNDGQAVDWKIRKGNFKEWLVTKDPYLHSRIQSYKQVTDEKGDSYVLALLWAKEGKEVEIEVSAVIDSTFRISAVFPFQSNPI